MAERLSSVNAAAAELGTTRPSLRKPSPARLGHAGPQPRGGPVAGERPAAERYEWVRRDEKYAMLSANVVVELNSESPRPLANQPRLAVIRRADRAHQRISDRRERCEPRQVNRTSRTDRTGRSPAQVQEREVVGGAH